MAKTTTLEPLSYLEEPFLTEYFLYLRQEKCMLYLAATLIVYGGFTLSECLSFTKDDLSGKQLVNPRHSRVLFFPEPFCYFRDRYFETLSGTSFVFWNASRKEVYTLQQLTSEFRRSFEAYGYRGGVLTLTRTFYRLYFANCATLSSINMHDYYRPDWIKKQLCMSIPTHDAYKEHFSETILPEQLTELLDKFQILCNSSDPVIQKKCHRIYSNLYDLVALTEPFVPTELSEVQIPE